jgi:NAD(P)-dependent dehydrogenase (short-subunit alcohol dehydrogenase family)
MKSEAAEVLAGIDLAGKVAVVTGGYSGIGVETTRALVNAGAKVHVPVRNPEQAAETLADIDGEVHVGEMDLSDLDSVRAYAESIRSKEPVLDLLINNAGIMACPETRVGSGWESQFAVNHLGHFVLTMQLLPSLLQASDPRVVCLSSVAHKRSDIRWDDIHFEEDPYEKWEAYGQAKTANALFGLGLDLKYRDQGLRAFSVHPGGILTPLQRHMAAEEMMAMGWADADGNISERAKSMFKTTTQGCSTTLWCATSPALENRGGVYCEDCDIANLATEESAQFFDVPPWAADDDSAVKLWDLTEKMLGL